MSWFKKGPFLRYLERITIALESIEKVVNYYPVVAKLEFKRRHGMPSTGSQSIQVGQTVTVSLVETRADGSVYSPSKGDVVLSVQDSTIASLVDNGDGTGVLTGLAQGSTNVGGVDSKTSLNAQGVLTVTPAVLPPPTSAAIVFGDPK